ncbi:hypothetical protein K432DRAFT_350130 [Lepidopterella palustris CBS 459.81]|uniref:DUF2415 domain-containing protein n=1 Tax=Lepidopterella palustris CBS 459.81 TaxID=1314670 RepID=A0A8E2ED87_9PEZI|nr:hypothetical protein K432DRAFT_350130 [Lepidopterella palustris CBS 459.81]
MAVDDFLHYQLRHFISSPEQDLIYYASGQDVYCLNTNTKTQAHVTTLPFDARCTASGYGWVCVGGAEDGHFAAIKVEGFPPANPSEVDALLSLDLASRTPLPRPPLLGSAHRVKLERIGEEIVNSISIHKLSAQGDGEDEVVAVLTNNDKTVRVYSLTQSLEVNVLDLPFAMNHATISPDGQLLVAVGDHQQVFFFERVKTQVPSMMKTPEGRSQSIPPEWSNFAVVQLYVPQGSLIEGYFTTAWSPSGSLCAVGSECGYITVFDTDLLKTCEYADDAIVQIVKSSRPDNVAGPGAVRTMIFSPPPWDLLIWSEDQARVCVADIRSSLNVKQVLSLDPKEEGLEKVDIAEFDIELSPELRELNQEADFIRRYRRALDSEGNAAAVNFATDYMEASAERRRLHRHLGVVESDNDPHGLTPHERQILEALRTTRQREEARERGALPRSIVYTPPTPTTNDSRRLNSVLAMDFFPNLRSERGANGLPLPSIGSLRDFLRERNLDPDRPPFQPRRQGSVVLSSDGSRSETNSNGNNISNSATTRSPNPIPPHARRTEQSESSSSDPSQTIEAETGRSQWALATPSRTSGQATEPRSEMRRLRQLAQARERVRSMRDTQGSLSTYDLGGYRRAATRRDDPQYGVRTAGLAMSHDGRKLYCGTEEGIFEFNINVQERKLFPAIEPR